MDLTLSRQGDYVVRAALALAESWEGGAYRTIGDIAAAMAIPGSWAAAMLGALSRAGLAEAKAGRGGGYRLSRHPSRIDLLQVVEAAEGPLVPTRCTLRDGPCRLDDVCVVHPAWVSASAALRSSLATTSLASVAARRSGRTYQAPSDRSRARPERARTG